MKSQSIREFADTLSANPDHHEVVTALYAAAANIDALDEELNAPTPWPTRDELPEGATSYTRIETVGGVSFTERVEF